MSEPTRADLRAFAESDYVCRPLTDAEFDRIAKEAGYVRLIDKVDIEAVRQGVHAYRIGRHGLAAHAWIVLAEMYLEWLEASDE